MPVLLKLSLKTCNNATHIKRNQHEQIHHRYICYSGGGPRVVVSTAAFHARVRGSFPDLGGLKKTKTVSSPSTRKTQYCGEPPWSRGFEFRILCLGAVSSHHPHEALLAQFSLYVHKSGLKPDSFLFITYVTCMLITKNVEIFSLTFISISGVCVLPLTKSTTLLQK